MSDFLDNLVERIVDYVEASHSNKHKTVNFLPASSREKVTDLSLPLEGHGSQAILDDLDEFLGKAGLMQWKVRATLLPAAAVRAPC